jgi:hypothetical protein
MKLLEAPLLDRLLDPLSRVMLTPESTRRLLASRFDPNAQARLDELARRCNHGALSPEEHREYEACVQTIDFIAIFKAKARTYLRDIEDQA